MIAYEYDYENFTPRNNLLQFTDKDNILFFDIETTGLSRQNNQIYLIGIGHYTDKGLHIIQWFAESEREEYSVLKAFIEYCSSFACLVNYNGKTFDIPFTTERMKKYSLEMPEFGSLDIYNLVKPLKRILSLDDITQKSVERFLGIKREDKYNGGELISVYKRFEKSYSSFSSCNNTAEYEKILPPEGKSELSKLLLHNLEDVLNMHYITDILDYNGLFNANIQYSSHEIKEYKDFCGEIKHELIISGLHNFDSIPKSFNTFRSSSDGSFIMNFSKSGNLQIRIPVILDTLIYFIPNYKDYYYLPSEKMCILKSMAGGVLKENRENAKKENCCITLKDSFIPVLLTSKKSKDTKTSEGSNSFDEIDFTQYVRCFKKEYKSKSSFMRAVDFESLSEENKSAYITEMYHYFFI